MENTISMKTYATFIIHDQNCYAAARAISLSQNEAYFQINKLSEELKAKLFDVIGWVYLTKEELYEIYDVSHGFETVDDRTMENLLKSRI